MEVTAEAPDLGFPGREVPPPHEGWGAYNLGNGWAFVHTRPAGRGVKTMAFFPMREYRTVFDAWLSIGNFDVIYAEAEDYITMAAIAYEFLKTHGEQNAA